MSCLNRSCAKQSSTKYGIESRVVHKNGTALACTQISGICMTWTVSSSTDPSWHTRVKFLTPLKTQNAKLPSLPPAGSDLSPKAAMGLDQHVSHFYRTQNNTITPLCNRSEHYHRRECNVLQLSPAAASSYNSPEFPEAVTSHLLKVYVSRCQQHFYSNFFSSSWSHWNSPRP